MKISVFLFARLKEIAGTGTVEIEGENLNTISDVWEKLCTGYPQLREFHRTVLFSRNREFAHLSTVIEEGDEIGLFPPVSGGAATSSGFYPQSPDGNIFQIVHTPIRSEQMVQQLSGPGDGAVVIFSGIVRDHSNGRKTLFLEYEGYEPMALKKMEEIITSARRNWDIDRIGIVHRLGRLEIGEASVLIVATANHRRDAFSACQFAIDTLKKTVPIWKKEFFEDGEVWVEGEPPEESLQA